MGLRHRHVHDGERPNRCLEVDPTVCLTRTTAGYLVHFDPPADGTDFRQVGAVRVAEGAWTETGCFDRGDLTLDPSIRVSDGRRELLHGWVRNGTWVSA